MTPERAKGRDKPRRTARDEYKVAYQTKELGRPLRRKLLQSRLNELSDSRGLPEASHGDESRMEKIGQTPREDRAG